MGSLLPAGGVPAPGCTPVPLRGLHNLWWRKGYFNLILGLYEHVSGDAKYDDLFKIVYDDSLSFEYDHKRIVDTLAKQWVANPIGIACEVRKIFLWCNNLSGLSVRLYDLLHGTSWFWTYQQCHNTMKQHHLSGPQGGPVESVSLYHDPDINYYRNGLTSGARRTQAGRVPDNYTISDTASW